MGNLLSSILWIDPKKRCALYLKLTFESASGDPEAATFSVAVRRFQTGRDDEK